MSNRIQSPPFPFRIRAVLAAGLLAAAGPLDDARAAWTEGRFLEAADMAEATARIMGRHGQTLSRSEASSRGYAGNIRNALDRALELDPDSPPALTGKAGWRAGVVDAAGSFMGRLLFGAREEEAHALFARALGRAPEAKAPLFEYARALQMLDGGTDRARALFRRGLALPAGNALDRILDERAAALLAELDAGG